MTRRAVLSILLCPVAALPAVAAPPTAVEAAAVGASQIRVYWNGAADARSYAVFRDGRQVAEVGADARQYDDGGLEPGHTYRYEVAAVDGAGAQERARPYLERTYPVLPAERSCDLLVVGATTAGVAAAVTGARYGLNVVLTEETRRLGGMPANGLGSTDLRRIANASGFFEEFRRAVRELYGTGDGLRYEPRVAQQAIKGLLWSAPGLTVCREVRPVKVSRRGERISEVVCEEVPTGRGVVFRPRLVIDATDTGDVAAWAGAPFRLGREPRSAREPHAGFIYYDRATDRPLPGSTGRGDSRLQAYAYLMTVKDYGPGADRSVPKPPGYDVRDYEHVTLFDKSWAVSSGRLPNGKFEVNEHPQGTDLQEINYRYPLMSYAERRRVEEQYRNHALGYLYYVQTVQGKRTIGLSDDDYRDTGGWPALLYIREARRFEAEVVLDETDIAEARRLIRPTAIGIGDYPMDSHAVQRKTDWSRPDMGEGEFYLPQYTPWHQVPYGVMVPRKVENLFVPTAVSATHVAYGTLRLEPVRMQLGEAAGIAAAYCMAFGLTPRQVPARQIQNELLKRRDPDETRPASLGIGAAGGDAVPAQLYLFTDVATDTDKRVAIEWLAARGFYPTPPPAERTSVSGLQTRPFEPDGSLLEDEAGRLLAKLSARARTLEPAAYAGLDGAPRYHAPTVNAGAVLTRARAAVLLTAFMGWSAPAGATRYADLTPGTPEQAAAEALRANWIDSVLWDHLAAFAPDGRLLFRPDQPITRAQFAQLLYLAHFHIGSTWEDL